MVFHITFGAEEIIFTVDYIGTTFDLCFPKLSIVNEISGRLIFGLGNIGQRNLIILRKFFPKFEILILRRKRKSPTIRLKNNEKLTYNIQEAINFDPNFAILCNCFATYLIDC